MERTEARQQIFFEATVKSLGVTGPPVRLGLDPFAGHRGECGDLRAVKIFAARDFYGCLGKMLLSRKAARNGAAWVVGQEEGPRREVYGALEERLTVKALRRIQY